MPWEIISSLKFTYPWPYSTVRVWGTQVILIFFRIFSVLLHGIWLGPVINISMIRENGSGVRKTTIIKLLAVGMKYCKYWYAERNKLLMLGRACTLLSTSKRIAHLFRWIVTKIACAFSRFLVPNGVCWRNWIAHLTTEDVHLCTVCCHQEVPGSSPG